MKIHRLLSLSGAFALSIASYANTSDYEKMNAFIDGLMHRMTLTEKVGQLNLLAVPSFVSGDEPDDNDSREQLIVEGKLGAMYGSFVAEDLLAAEPVSRRIQALSENHAGAYTRQRRPDRRSRGSCPRHGLAR